MLWKDESFPTSKTSLYYNGSSQGSEFHWLRPTDLCSTPTLKGKYGTSLPVQGSMGDCWLICAFYALAKCEHLWRKVFERVVDDVFSENYDGKISMNLWNNGKWVEVEIDNYLPVRCSGTDHTKWELVYSRCEDPTQFWAPLLEKACAKLFGCYESLYSGQVSEGYHLITGGYCWTQDLTPQMPTESLTVLSAKITQLLSTLDSCVFMSCDSTLTESIVDRQRDVAVSDVPDSHSDLHCYVITGMEHDRKKQACFNLWNLWEESGTNLSKHCTISLQRLCQYEPRVTYAAPSIQNIFNISLQQKFAHCWSERIITDEWKGLQSCGGNKTCASYSKNPQILLDVKIQNCEIFHFTLLQSSHRKCRRRKELEQAIGLHVFQLPSKPNSCLTLEQLKSLHCVSASCPEYQYSQNATVLTYVPADSKQIDKQCYLAVPSTHSPNVNAEFVLRISCSAPVEVVQLK